MRNPYFPNSSSRIKSTFFTLIYFFIFGATSWADTPAEEFRLAHQDFFHLLHPNKSEIILGYSMERSVKEDGGQGEFDLNNFKFLAELPQPIDQDTYFLYGLNYEARLYDFTPVVSPTTVSSKTVHKIAFTFGGGHFVSEDFLVSGYVSPGMYSDFDTISSDTFNLYGGGQLTYRFNPFTEFLLGIRASEDFEDVFIFPIGGFRIKSSDGFLHLSVTLPLDATVSINNSANLTSYFKISLSGDRYNIDGGALNKNFDMQVQERRIGGGVIYWINEHLNIGAELGASAQSRLEFKTPSPGQFRGDLKNDYYLTAQIGIAL